MGLWSRLLLLFRIRAHRLASEAEDPRETLEFAYARQLELQQQMRRGVADVVTSRKRIELQARQLDTTSGRLEGQARTALQQGREDLAREALTRRAMLRAELNELNGQSEAMAAEEAKLLEASRRLDLRVQQFRARKEAAKATYTAARARAQLGEAMGGFGDDAELVLAVQRAEDRISDTRARADALESMMAAGALEDPTLAGDPFQRELDMAAADFEVSGELARLKGEVAKGQLGEGPP
jgi:phage shock protein A